MIKNPMIVYETGMDPEIVLKKKSPLKTLIIQDGKVDEKMLLIKHNHLYSWNLEIPEEKKKPVKDRRPVPEEAL